MKWRSPQSAQNEIDTLRRLAFTRGLTASYSMMTDSWRLIDKAGQAVRDSSSDDNSFTAIDAIQFLKSQPGRRPLR